VLILKKKGKWQVNSDYHKLNTMTTPDSYSLPNNDEIFNSLEGPKNFSLLGISFQAIIKLEWM